MGGISIRKIVALIIGILVLVIGFFISSLIIKGARICDPENPDILKCPMFFNPFYIEPNYCNHVFGSEDGDITHIKPPVEFCNMCCALWDSDCLNKKDCIGCVFVRCDPTILFEVLNKILSSIGSDFVQLKDKSFFLHWNASDMAQSSIRIKNHAYLFESVGDIASAFECCAEDNCNSDNKDGVRVKKGILDINNVDLSCVPFLFFCLSQEGGKKTIVEEITRLYCGISYKKCLMCNKDFEKKENTAWYVCTIFDYPKILNNGLESGIISVKPNTKITIDGEEWFCNKNFEWEKIK
ncbi:MAG: hypothetical protein QW641_01770 [Candidatus Aenigmatarchaeota archaeon]